MLDISKYSTPIDMEQDRFGAFRAMTNPRTPRMLAYWLIGFAGFGFLLLFLPWTQNIRGHGKVTTLTPEDRPQTLQSRIDGRIERWYVQEGDTVRAGDTIVFISEIKDQYFDPNLLRRTQEQLNAREKSGGAYQDKIMQLERQIAAERNNLRISLQQARNKISIARRKVGIDSAEVEVAKTAYKIAEDQVKRAEIMYKQEGILSLRELENRRNKMQEAAGKLVATENKLDNANRELINATIDLNGIETEYLSKIFKIESEIQTANTELFKTDEDIAKLNNTYANYSIRSRFWHITAPKDGQVVKILKAGLGENVAAGEPVLTITALKPRLAIEMYVRPVDLPLMQRGEQVRIMFDGWPTIVFSGWPGVSFGTFGGRISSIDSDISENGMYRMLVAPDSTEIGWPNQIRVGAGAQGFALLEDVPIWYELWRQINGFPPNFYQVPSAKASASSPKKAK